MTVRDYRALEGLELVPFDAEFDLARAVKSEAELESVRESVRINEDGFEAFLAAYEPGKTAAEAMAAAEELFVERGCGRLTMNMVLIGPEFGIASKETKLGDFVLPSLEVAGPGMHWVEVSRAIGKTPPEVEPMVEAYEEYHAAARTAMRDGATAHDVHRAVSKGFTERGYHLGHVTGHSIGMTMIEHPRVGEGLETVLRSGMVLSMHPHAIASDGKACLYMQDTWLVGPDGRRAALAPADAGVPARNLLRAIAGADRLAELLPLEEQAAAGAIGGNHACAHQERLEQDDPENGVPDHNSMVILGLSTRAAKN